MKNIKLRYIFIGFSIMFILYLIMANWDFSKLGNSESIELSGTLHSSDKRIKLNPERIDFTYRGIRIKILYEIDKDLKSLGFEYQNHLPSFALEENPDSEIDEEPYGSWNIKMVQAEVVTQQSDHTGDYFVVYFPYGDVKHRNKVNSYRLFLTNPGRLEKKFEKSYEVKLDKVNKIKLDGIGTYEVYLQIKKQQEEKINKLYIKTTTYSDMENPFQVNDQVLAIDGKDSWSIRGGSGIGENTGESPVWTFQGNYDIDSHFANAPLYQLRIFNVILDIESDPLPVNKEYIDLQLN